MSKAVKKILDQERVSLQCVRFHHADGTTRFAYVLIQRARLAEFEALVVSGAKDFSEIGTVILTGAGEPSDDTTQDVLAKITRSDKA